MLKHLSSRQPPTLYGYRGDASPSFLALLGQKKKKALVLGKDGGIHPIETSQIAKMLCGPMEEMLGPQIKDLLNKAKIPGKKGPKSKG